jgi:trk system potassium uptake protein TrkA
MKKQYVVFGAGKFGGSIAVTLQKLGCDVIVVDKNPEIIQDIADEVSYAVCADVEDPETFTDLNIHDMNGAIISMTGNLEASIVTTMTCAELGVPRIMAKAKNELHERILRKVGAHKVIYPELEMGRRVAKYLVADNFADWIELSANYSLVEMEIPSSWIGRSLEKLKLRAEYGLNVIGIKDGENVTISPDPGKPLPAGVIMIVVGPNKSLEGFQK